MRQSRWPRVPMAEHREPCESRGSRTVLGAPGGEIPPGDSTISDLERATFDGRSSTGSRHAAPGRLRTVGGLFLRDEFQHAIHWPPRKRSCTGSKHRK